LSGKLGAIVAGSKPSGPRPIDAWHPMPWGKHKGVPIEELPRDYLVWTLQKTDACNPDHERYWPEFRELLESMVGPHAPVKPAPMSIVVLCSRLRAEGVTLELHGNVIVPSENIDAELLEAIQANRSLLASILPLASDTPARLGGSARLIQGVEFRSLVKAWYGRLSRQFHPDAGGSSEAQIVVNAGYKAMNELVSEWEKTK
jgi:Putative quorum-sensing-regulated virulence factor